MTSGTLTGKFSVIAGGRPVSITASPALLQVQRAGYASASSIGNANLCGGKCRSTRASRRGNRTKRGASTVVCASRPHKVALLGMFWQLANGLKIVLQHCVGVNCLMHCVGVNCLIQPNFPSHHITRLRHSEERPPFRCSLSENSKATFISLNENSRIIFLMQLEFYSNCL